MNLDIIIRYTLYVPGDSLYIFFLFIYAIWFIFKTLRFNFVYRHMHDGHWSLYAPNILWIQIFAVFFCSSLYCLRLLTLNCTRDLSTYWIFNIFFFTQHHNFNFGMPSKHRIWNEIASFLHSVSFEEMRRTFLFVFFGHSVIWICIDERKRNFCLKL